MLAPQQHSGLSGYTAQGLAGGVDDIPFAVNLTAFGIVVDICVTSKLLFHVFPKVNKQNKALFQALMYDSTAFARCQQVFPVFLIGFSILSQSLAFAVLSLVFSRAIFVFQQQAVSCQRQVGGVAVLLELRSKSCRFSLSCGPRPQR